MVGRFIDQGNIATRALHFYQFDHAFLTAAQISHFTMHFFFADLVIIKRLTDFVFNLEIAELAETVERFAITLDFNRVGAHMVGVGIDNVRQAGVLRQVTLDIFERRFVLVTVVFLTTGYDCRAALDVDFALIVFIVTNDDIEQGRFASTIATN